jgi:hypothetical protein
MFWDLNGATGIPRFTRQRQIAATVTLFPTWDAEPITNRDMPVLICGIPDHKKQGYRVHEGILNFMAKSGQVSPKISSFRQNTSLFLPAMPSNK